MGPSSHRRGFLESRRGKPGFHGTNAWLQVWRTGFQALALSLTSCVVSGKSLDLSEL